MEREIIDIEEIGEILRDKKLYHDYIKEHRSMTLEMIAEMDDKTKDDFIRCITLSGKPLSTIQVQSTNTHRDFIDNIERVDKYLVEQLEEYQRILRSLENLESKIERVWVCYSCSSPKSFLILNRLYVKAEKWENVIMDMKISRTTLKNLRKNALQEVQHLYMLDKTNSEIKLNMQINSMKSLSFARKASKRGSKEQMNLFDNCPELLKTKEEI